MNHRYDYDIRRAQKRRDDKTVPATWGVLLVVVLLVAAAAALLMGVMREDASKAKPRTAHDSMTVTYTYDGASIRWYVMTDPDTGVQYVVNDMGGCCVRVTKDGSPMYVGALNDR